MTSAGAGCGYPAGAHACKDKTLASTPRQLIVEVDEGRCTGVGYCEVCAPAVFRLDARRIARVLDPNGADEAVIMEAAQKCPVDAIIVETAQGELLWPR